MGVLQGKVAIVLGATGQNNIGQTIARLFKSEGAEVVVSGRRGEVLSEFAAEIGAAAHECDITSKAQVGNLVEFAKKTYGRVDIGINSTGWGLLRSLEDTTEEDLERMVTLQFKGPFFYFQALVKAMDRGGSIIQISSATATIMLEAHSAYMGTKAGTDHVVRTIANEYGAKGIRANSISPGVTDTPMLGGSLDEPAVMAAFTREYPLGRIGTSQDVAHAALWLAQDECFMTGQNLQVNGGLTLRRNPTGAEIYAAMSPEAMAYVTT